MDVARGRGNIRGNECQPRTSNIHDRVAFTAFKKGFAAGKDCYLRRAGPRLYDSTQTPNLVIPEGVLKLEPRSENSSANMPIDCLLRSLAKDQTYNAIAVILSETSSGGALAIGN